jgi:AhpD family alkylhydroperoxidase
MNFKKRKYESLKELFTDLCFTIRNSSQLRKVKSKGLISTAFQERLMLAVISVENCRYCSYFHSKLSLKNGITQEEIGQLLSGDFHGCPEEEALAVLYAQHWAESNTRPDPESVEKLKETYGSEKAEAINIMLRTIRLGSLSGNTLDYLLYRISFGKWRRL